MKKKTIIVFFVIFLLGCQPQEASPSGIAPSSQEKPTIGETAKLTIPEKDFHFVIGWLTDNKIAYVAKDKGKYIVNSFDINSGKIEKIYEDSSIIVDVLIHPNGKNLLIHTTDHTTAANVKIITLDGLVLHETTIESTEISIEWNSYNPNIVLLTAFAEDWTYEVMVYDGDKNTVNAIDIENPFPKWLGESQIISLEDSRLNVYDLEMGKQEPSIIENISFLHTNKDRILIGQVVNSEYLKYSLLTKSFETLWSYEIPVQSNNSDGTFSEIHWLSEDEVMITAIKESGQQEEMIENFDIVKMNKTEMKKIGETLEPNFRCQPSGEACLVGFQLEKMSSLTEDYTFEWLQFE